MGIVDKAKAVIEKGKINVEKFMLNSVKNSLIDGAIYGQIEKAEKKSIRKQDGLVRAELLLKIDITNRKTVNSLNYVLAAKPKVENRLEGNSPLTEAEIQGQMKTAQTIAKMANKNLDTVSAIFISCKIVYEKLENNTYKKPSNIELGFLVCDNENKTSKFLL